MYTLLLKGLIIMVKKTTTNPEFNREQLQLNVIARAERFRQLSRDNMLTSSILTLRILYEVLANLTSVFSRKTSYKDIENNGDVFLYELVRLVSILLLLLYVPYKLTNYRANRAVQAIVNTDNLKTLSDSDLRNVNERLKDNISAIQTSADRKFYLTCAAFVVGYILANYSSAKNDALLENVVYAKTLAEKGSDEGSLADISAKLVAITKKLRNGKDLSVLSSEEKLFLQSETFKKFSRTAETMPRSIFAIAVTGLGLSFAQYFFDNLTLFSTPMLIGHTYSWYKRRQAKNNLTAQADKQLKLLKDTFERFGTWEMSGDGVDQVQLFTLKIDGDADQKKIISEELVVFCKYYNLRIAMATSNSVSIFLPSLAVGQIELLKNKFLEQLKERQNIEKNYPHQLSCLNRFFAPFLPEWKHSVRRSDNKPIAVFKLKIEGLDSDYVDVFVKQLRSLFPDFKINIQKGKILLHGISLEEEASYRSAARQLAEHDPSATQYDNDNNVAQQSSRSARSSQKGLFSQVFTAASATFYKPVQPPTTLSWDYSKKKITFDGQIAQTTNSYAVSQQAAVLGTFSDVSAVQLRNPHQKVPLYFAVIATDICNRMRTNSLSLEEMSLILKLVDGTLQGAEGTGIKYDKSQPDLGTVKVKRRDSALRFWGKQIAEDQNSGTVLFEFDRFAKGH